MAERSTKLGTAAWKLEDELTKVNCKGMVRTMGKEKDVNPYQSELQGLHPTVSCILTDEPDFSDIEVAEYDWSKSIYGNVSEAVPKDAPEPLCKPVTTTHYQDANLYHDIITGQSVTAILHFLNKFPIDWYSKKQATVKTATYGSEYISARTCVNQIVDL
jgi:hypothetical protein